MKVDIWIKKLLRNFAKMNLRCTESKKQRNVFYLTGHDLLCGIDLQKSNYGDVYYVNYYYFIGEFEAITGYPTHCESDIQGRITVMSRKQTSHGKQFMTAQIEYEEYTEEELRPFFERAFEEEILPPVEHGKSFILDNIGKLYSLTMRKEEVLRKLKL